MTKMFRFFHFKLDTELQASIFKSHKPKISHYTQKKKKKN